MKEHTLQDIVAVTVAMAKSVYNIELPREKVTMFIKASLDFFMFQPHWYGMEWSNRHIDEMYFRISFKPDGIEGMYTTVYYDFKTDKISLEF